MELTKIKMTKKGQLGGLYSGVLTIAIVGILIAIVMYIFSSIGAQLPANGAAANATDTLTAQFTDFLPWLGIILLVLAAGIVLFFVVRSFAGGSARGA